MSTNDFSDTRPVGLYDDALGSKRRDYYRDKFEDFDQKGEGWHPSWNWAAFFFTGFWALYRKMYGWAFAWLVAFTIFGVLGRNPSNKASFWLLVWNLAVVVSFATFSNAIYHRKIKARIAAARLSNPDPSRVSRRLIAGGGVHAWVLIALGAIPVMGIVAAVVMPVVYQDYNKPKTKPIVNWDEGKMTLPTANPFEQYDKPVSVNPFEETQKITKRSEINEFDPSTARPVNNSKNHPFTYEEAVAPTVSITPEQAQEHFRRIDAAHPDANAIVTSPAFQSWVAQYSSYQRIFAKGTAQEVIDMITAYKNQR